jgi:ectoine hydroxylase-related dioxygenase (phytanoyl-CoA dioxygenase family)
MLTPRQRHQLDDDGYVIMPDLLDSDALTDLRLAFDVQPQTHATQHVELQANIPGRSAWQMLETHPRIAAAAMHVLARPFRVRDLHGRNPSPGFGQQGLHADWPPRAAPARCFVVTVVWMFDDFTELNGGTRVVPGTHRMLHAVPKALAQPLAHHPAERNITGSAGSALVLNGHLWHSGRDNQSTGPRRAGQMVIVADE